MAGLLPTLIGTALGTAAITKTAPPIIAKLITNQGIRAGLPLAEQLAADKIEEEFRTSAKAIQLLKKQGF